MELVEDYGPLQGWLWTSEGVDNGPLDGWIMGLWKGELWAYGETHVTLWLHSINATCTDFVALMTFRSMTSTSQYFFVIFLLLLMCVFYDSYYNSFLRCMVTKLETKS